MDMTVVLGLHKFKLQATIDRHGPCMYSGQYDTSINCCKNAIVTKANITEFEINTQNSSTAHAVIYKLIT